MTSLWTKSTKRLSPGITVSVMKCEATLNPATMFTFARSAKRLITSGSLVSCFCATWLIVR